MKDYFAGVGKDGRYCLVDSTDEFPLVYSSGDINNLANIASSLGLDIGDIETQDNPINLCKFGLRIHPFYNFQEHRDFLVSVKNLRRRQED